LEAGHTSLQRVSSTFDSDDDGNDDSNENNYTLSAVHSVYLAEIISSALTNSRYLIVASKFNAYRFIKFYRNSFLK